MRQICLLLITATLSINQQACRSRQQTDNQPADSTSATAVETTSDVTTEVPISERLADLGLTADSDWRGINLGDAFTKIKATEKGKPFESDARHIGYTVELKNLETTDILYSQTNQNVSTIDVDLFLNSRQSVDAYQRELSQYFTVRYGALKSGNGGSAWNGRKGESISLRDVSKGKDFGLKIKISPVAGTVSASAK